MVVYGIAPKMFEIVEFRHLLLFESKFDESVQGIFRISQY